MSFRKRNAPILGARSFQSPSRASAPGPAPLVRLPGTRPSPADGRLVTSTGTGTLDNLLAGHGGLPLGTHLLVEESGTTDYAGALLRFYAAEGLLQGHHVHVVGLPESWGRELPGAVVDIKEKVKEIGSDADKMKIAWRYEMLGQQDIVTRDRAPEARIGPALALQEQPTPFSHNFDLTKRLKHPPDSKLDFITLDQHPSKNPFAPVLSSLTLALSTSQTTVHRLILPTLFSPALYPRHSHSPAHVLSAIHSLRSLLSSYPTRLTILTSIPTSVYPRALGLTKWIEILVDGVLELIPFPHSSDAEFAISRDPNTKEEPPQGLIRIHKLPILHELGSGFPPADMDWTFTLSRRKLTIKPYNLPPIEGDTDSQQSTGADTGSNKPKKADMEF